MEAVVVPTSAVSCEGPMVGTLGIKGAAQACLGLFGLDFGQMLGPSGEAQIVALGFVRRKTNLSALREWS